MKKPSQYARMDHQGYLGHFAKAQFLDQGHNECEGAEDKEACREFMSGLKAEADQKEEKYKSMSRAGGDFQRALDKRRGKY